MNNKILFKTMQVVFIFLMATGCNVKHDKAAYIVDGDTFYTSTHLKVRLAYIDCPEHNQEYGQQAKELLSKLVLGKDVKMVTHGKDKYGRTIAEIFVNNINVNEELVKAGAAWAYNHYSTQQFINDEHVARANHTGLWATANAIPPFKFRHK